MSVAHLSAEICQRLRLIRPSDRISSGEMLQLVVELTTSERERLLLTKISELRARMLELTEELEEEKAKHSQLQQKLKSVTGREQL